jgi:hypothetical protein
VITTAGAPFLLRRSDQAVTAYARSDPMLWSSSTARQRICKTVVSAAGIVKIFVGTSLPSRCSRAERKVTVR